MSSPPRPPLPEHGPRAGHGGHHTGLAVGLLALLLFSPIAVVVTLLTMALVIRQRRFHWWVPLAFGLAGLAAVAGGEYLAGLSPVRVHLAADMAWWLQVIRRSWSSGPLLDVLAAQLPLAVPVGVIAGAALVGTQEMSAGEAEWHPMEQRRREINHARAMRKAAALVADAEAQEACTEPPLGVDLGGDLAEWRQGGFVVIPKETRYLAMAVVGASGTGKTVTLQRLGHIAGATGRKLVFVDCKGDDELPAALIAAYRASNPDARVAFWPAQPMDMWRGSPVEKANQLQQSHDWSEVYYKGIASLAVRLALTAPDLDGSGPVRSGEEFLRRLSADELRRLWAGRPQMGDVERVTRKPDLLDGVYLRYSGFFSNLQGRFDGGWSFEDVDVAVVSVSGLEPEDAEAAVRVLLGDYGHYAARRKPHFGEDSLLIVDEFSAVPGAARIATDRVERLRSARCQLVMSAQSYQGLGRDDDERRRLLAGMSGGVVVHRCADPDELLRPAGTVRATEQSWQLGRWGADGMGNVRMAHRMRVDADAVRQAGVGEAWVIQAGQAAHLQVLPPPIPAELAADARLRVAMARQVADAGMAEGVRAIEQPWWVPLEAPSAPAALPPAALLELGPGKTPDDPGPHDPPPMLPMAPALRVTLALRAAVREGDHEAARAVVAMGRQMAPPWDGGAEYRRLCAERNGRSAAKRVTRLPKGA